MFDVALMLWLGVAAGGLTTVAGLGGGLLLLLGLTLLWDPVRALAVTTPALLIGNLHRGWVLRDRVDWAVARAFALGAVPGAALGGLAAVSVPPVAVNVLMLLVTALSLGRALGAFDLRAPARAMTPAGFVIGGLTGTAGGAGVLTGPLFLSAGLTGDAYAGTIAASGVAMHLGRVAGYGAGGLLTRELWLWSGSLAVALVAGNALGRRLRRFTDRLPEGALEHAVLVVCVVLAVTGLGRG